MERRMSKTIPEWSVGAARQRRSDRSESRGTVDRDADRKIAGRAQVSDQHASWLKEWRTLRTGGIGGEGAMVGWRSSMRALERKIAETPATTLSGLKAQAELISELAWNDVVAAAARQLLAGLKRLDKENDG
jgi:hypothetical protein